MIAKTGEKDSLILSHILIFFFIVFVITIGISSYIIAQERKLEKHFYPNVYIDGNDVGRKTKEEVLASNKGREEKLSNVQLEVLFQDNTIATFSGKMLKLQTNLKDIIERAYSIGRTPHTSTRMYQKLTTLIPLQKYEFDINVTYDMSTIEEFIINMEEIYNKPAKNALFTFENNKVTTFRKEEKGLKINSKQFYLDLEHTLKQFLHKVEPKSITLYASEIEPEVTLAKSNKFGIEELIGEGKSDYSHSSPERIHNVILAASKFHGVLIPKDEEISFNKIIGDISSTTGYKQAYIIQAGRTVLGDGGGVCQISTTLFRAGLNTGLPVIERHAHAYRVRYYENDSKPGLDATIYSPSIDLRMKNDTPASILIQTEVDKENNLVYFRFYGKKDNRKAELSPIEVYGQVPPPEAVNQDDPTLKKGIVKQVEYPAWGSKAKFTYKVSKDDKVHFEETFYSNYRPWRAVFLVGTAE